MEAEKASHSLNSFSIFQADAVAQFTRRPHVFLQEYTTMNV